MFPLLDAHVHVVDNMKISTIGAIFCPYWQHIYEVKYVVSTVDATFSISFVQCFTLSALFQINVHGEKDSPVTFSLG